MAKAAAGKVVIGDFHNQLMPERLPFGGLSRVPAARAARRSAGEPRWSLGGFKARQNRGAFDGR